MNERGFILTDMLLSLFIFLMIVSFIPLALQIMLEKNFVHTELQNLEWEVFLNQLKKEVRISESINVHNNKLLLYIDGRNITYEVYGNKIRRRVNSTGHEVTLQEVHNAEFTLVKNGVSVEVIDSFMKQKKAKIRSYLQFDGVNTSGT